ncbi:Purple acid phosphatase 8 [Glycine soja]
MGMQLVFIGTIALCLVVSSAVLEQFEQAPKQDGSLSFLVVDKLVATDTAEKPQTVIAEEEQPMNIVLFLAIQSVLGNHDYRGNVEARLSPVLTNLDKRWLCLRSFTVNAEVAEFYFVDTTPFVDKYFTEPKDMSIYDWSGILPRKQYISNLLKDVDLALQQSNAKWKIVVGHHTIRSAGLHGNTDELVKQLLPILEANNIDLYINGQDHCLQHIGSLGSAIQFLASGGGSKAWRGVVNWWKPEEMKFYYDGQGFMSVKITETEIDIVFYDVYGHVLHKWNAS